MMGDGCTIFFHTLDLNKVFSEKTNLFNNFIDNK